MNDTVSKASNNTVPSTHKITTCREYRDALMRISMLVDGECGSEEEMDRLLDAIEQWEDDHYWKEVYEKEANEED